MTTSLVGLAGSARSGKDTAGQGLVTLGWQRRAFADAVKNLLYQMDPVVMSPMSRAIKMPLQEAVDFHGWESVKKADPAVRRYLQRLGTEAGRGILGESVWVDALFDDADAWGPTIITDVRFPNEAEAIRERGGLVVEVVRPGQTLIAEAGHSSETALAEWAFDATLVNDGTEETLRQQLRDLTQSR
ncbi:hypothetical protein AB0H73_18855 [Streptomyces olivoreticuli]